MNTFAGLGTLVRLFARRDRVRAPIWIAAVTLSVVGSFASFPGLYTTQEAIDLRYDVVLSNPGGIALTGPGYGRDRVTPERLGALGANEMSASTIIAMALMGIFLMVRHTRGDEEAGRLELLRAGVVGRYAPVTAAMLVVAGALLATGLAVATGLMALGYEAAGSLAVGLSMAACGVVFAALAGLTAQLTENARAASGLAIASFAVAFFVRVAGDVQQSALTWWSPVGWVQAVRPFASEQWWVFAPLVALALALLGASYALLDRRDVGAGLLAARPGPARARPGLERPFALALRLQRGVLLWWAIGMFVFATMVGSIALEGERMMEALDVYAVYFQAAGGASLAESFLSAYLGFVAMTSVGFALQSAVALRTEAVRGRTESILAAGVDRTQWYAGWAGASALGTLVVLTVSGIGAAAAYAASIGDSAAFPGVFLGMLNYVPTVWLLAAAAVALYGLAPKLLPVVWVALAWVIVIGFLGPLLGLPEALLSWTPFAYTPQMPAQPFDAVSFFTMIAAIVALVVVGAVGFSMRDLDVA